METVFGPRGDSAILALTASSQTFALGTMAATNPAIRLIALTASHLAWYLKFGTSGAVTVSRTDGMRLVPGSKETPVVIPVPSGSTHVAILCEGASGDALISYGGFDNGEFSPLGASQIIAVTQTDQRIALPTLDSTAPAIRLVSTASNIEALWIKLGNGSVTGSVTTSMKVFPGSVEKPTLIPVTSGETHLSIFCEGVGGDIVLTGGGIDTGINFPVYTAGPGIEISAGLEIQGKFTRRTITNIAAGDTVATTDRAARLRITGSSSGTLAFQPIATLGNGFFCWIHNNGTGDVTLNPDGSEQIDGLTSWILYPGGCILVQVTASDITTVLITPMNKIFTASGTLTKPGCGTRASGVATGAGASGGRAGANDGGAGGGGGASVPFDLPLTSFGATETVTIGTGGPAQTVDNQPGTAGTSTTLGSLVTAFGGGAGDGISVNPGGGGGGGTLGAGASVSNSADGGNGGAPTGGIYGGDGGSGGSQSGEDNTFGGGGGGSGMNAATGLRGGDSVWGGGGGSGGAGAATSPGRGGNSIWGGAGGGGGSDSGTPGAGGTSTFAGNGGAGATGAAAATAGTAPGGGGGGSETGNSGAGARGELRVEFR